MASARDELFDQAVNRAAEYASRLALPFDDVGKLRAGLELWYLKTRFAYRAPLEQVLEALAARPPTTDAVWQGGLTGVWLVS
ncbi:MAG TPA: hypothetical protein VFD39_07070 [Trueperaceae bacterium]|nr:hypothetical protein [Trueperaceae bacterium]